MRYKKYILLFAMLLLCRAAYAEDNSSVSLCFEKQVKASPVFYMDFEDYSHAANSTSGFEKKDSTAKIRPSLDKTHGVCAAPEGTFFKSLDNPITKGKYVLSYDIKKTENSGLFVIRPTKTASRDFTLNNLYETMCMSDTSVGYYANSRGWTVTRSLAYKPDTWYRISMWMDFDNGKIYYYADNKLYGTSSMPNTAYGYYFSMSNGSATNVTLLDNVSLYKADYDFTRELTQLGIEMPEKFRYPFTSKVSTVVSGNAFVSFDDVKINVELSNITDEPISYNAVYSAVNYAGDVVWSLSEEKLTAAAGETLTREIKPLVDRYDVYKFCIALSDAETNAYLLSHEEQFCVMSVPDDDYVSSRYGACIHLTNDTTNWEDVKDLVDVSGMGFLREGFSWSVYETEKGKYGAVEPLKSEMETFFRDAKEMGVEILNIYSPWNMLYGVTYDDKVPRTKEALEAMERAAEHQAREYKDYITYYELGNELDFASQEEMSCEDYALALQYFYRGIKKGNPNAVVVACCLNRADPWWLERFIEKGGKGYFDAISIHSYHGSSTPERYGMIPVQKAVTDKMAEMGCGDAELWTTEGNGSVEPTWFSEQTQANSLVRLFALCDGYNMNDKFIYFMLQSKETTDDELNRFGIVRSRHLSSPNSPMLAFLAMTNFFARTQNAEYYDMIQHDNVWIYRYKKPDGSYLALMYSDNEIKTISLDFGASSGKYYDMYGNTQALSSQNGAYTFVLTDEPCYFEYSGDNFKETADPFCVSGVFNSLVPGNTCSVMLTVLQGMTVEAKGRDCFDISTEKSGEQTVINVTLKEIPKTAYYMERAQDYGTIRYRDYIEISVTDGKKCAAYIPLWIEYVNYQADVRATVKPFDETGYKYWTADIEVANNNISKPISGKLVLNDDAGNKISDITVENVLTGEPKQYSVTLPKSLTDGRTHLISGVLTLDGGEEIPFALGDVPRSFGYKANSGTNIKYIKKAKDAPVIDGIIDGQEWSDCKITDFDKSQVSYGAQGITIAGLTETETFGKDADYGGKSDFSGSIYARWDKDFMYVAAIVYDDVHHQNQEPVRFYYNDCFYLLTVPTVTQRHDTRIDIALTSFYENHKGNMYISWSQLWNYIGSPVLIPEGDGIGMSKVIRNNNATIYEARIPWVYVIDSAALADRNFQITFGFRDYDGDRDKTYNYSGWFCLTD